MRKDMQKVLTERPRHNRNWSYGDFRKKLSRGDLEDLPTRLGMRKPYQTGYDIYAKSFSDRLGPLKRFLHSSIGRCWNDIWSDICSGLVSGNTTHDHLKDHVRWMVETNTFLEDGKILVHDRWGGARDVSGFYVHPTTGTLLNSDTNRRRNKVKTHLVDGIHYTKDENGVLTPYQNYYRSRNVTICRKIMGPENEIAKRDGIWYRVIFDTVPEPSWQTWGIPGSAFYREGWVYHTRTDALTGDCCRTGQRYRSHFTTLNRRDLKRFGVSND